MPKGSRELTNSRRVEIINACEELYKTMSFKEITMKKIGEATSFTRTSLYNYFRTKEEIFLALFGREYELWAESLERIRTENEKLTRLEFAKAMAASLSERKNLLKLLSMNLYDMEENSRMERLVEFKTAYGRVLDEVSSCLEKFFPEMMEKDRQGFILSFFPFMFGIYPYTFATEKQRRAMELAGVYCPDITIYDIILAEVKRLLGA